MSITVKVAAAQEPQLQNENIALELSQVQAAMDASTLRFSPDCVSFLFLEGQYLHVEHKLWAACLFVNTLGYPIKELHGVLRLQFRNESARIAKMTLNFDEAFLGRLEDQQGLLVHFGFPVSGLSEDRHFGTTELSASFQDVRVTGAEPL